MAVTQGELMWTPPRRRARRRRRSGGSWTGSPPSAASPSTTTTRLLRWSVDDLEGFWAAIWDFFGVRAHTPYERVLSERVMPGARWFEGATLNYAEHMVGLDEDLDRVAVLARSQTRDPVELTFARPARPGRAGARRARAPRRRPRRPRRRVPAEHPRDARRVPRDREPRRDLGDVRAGVRRARGDRPLRRSSSRRCCSPSRATATGPSTSTAAPRSPRSARSCGTLEHVVHVPYAGGARRRAARTRASGTTSWPSPRRCASTRCRSTTRCTCCSRPAPPGCRSRSSTATAASSSRRFKNHGLSWDLRPGDRLHVVHDDRVDDVERARLRRSCTGRRS